MEFRSNTLIKPMLDHNNKKIMIIPDDVLKAAGFRQGDNIYIYASNGSIFIQKAGERND